MADQVPADLTVEQWDDNYFEDFVNKDWWKKFTGTESSSMIITKESLVERPGTKVHLSLVNELSSGALGENDLYEGNERQMQMRDFGIEVHEYGQPVKYKNFEQKKTAIELRQVYKSGLETWNMKLRRDLILEAMCCVYDSSGVSYNYTGSTTSPKAHWNWGEATAAHKNYWQSQNEDRVLFGQNLANTVSGDHAASLANVNPGTTGKITPATIDLMKYMAEHPATGKPKIGPMEARKSINDQHGYTLFVDDLILRDIRANPEFQTANREARQRGTDNPIFSGADYIWNKVAIYSIPELKPLPGVGASASQVGRAILCGNQNIGVAWGKRPWTVDEKLDYQRFSGMAIMQWMEVDKLRWGTGPNDKDNPCDHGQVTGFFSATPYA